jgi:hypothetical protein
MLRRNIKNSDRLDQQGNNFLDSETHDDDLSRDINRSETRIAVLEQIAETHDRRITDIEDFHRLVVERFDQKIQSDTANQVVMEKTLVKAVTSLENLSCNLEKVLILADSANKLATKHETIGLTVLKVAGGMSLIFGAAWAIFKFFVLGA